MLPVQAQSDSGSITINNALADQTYTIYKILNLESYDTTSGQYSYSVPNDWKDFFTGSNAGASYMRADSNRKCLFDQLANSCTAANSC